MVRIASVALIFGKCVADDVFYHTQLLQTKMNPQKVSIETTGDVSPDETNLFQKSIQLSSKEVAGKKLLKILGKHLDQGKPGKRGGKGPEKGGDEKGGRGKGPKGPPEEQGAGPDPEVAAICTQFYGHEVDIGQCASCYGQVAAEYEAAGGSQAMAEDPNGMVRQYADMADECMGTTNLVTSTCEEHYGADVPLFDCMMCGEMCECSFEGCPDPQCHPGCMAGAAEVDSSSSTYMGTEEDCSHECQLFYGPEADAAQCKECGETCVNASMNAAQEMMMSASSSSSYGAGAMGDMERVFFETLISCSDNCMAPLVNLPAQACKTHYGDEVDLVQCFTCGMMCGCDMEGNCEWCDHGECMAGEGKFGSSSFSYSSYLQKAKKAAAKKEPSYSSYALGYGSSSYSDSSYGSSSYDSDSSSGSSSYDSDSSYGGWSSYDSDSSHGDWSSYDSDSSHGDWSSYDSSSSYSSSYPSYTWLQKAHKRFQAAMAKIQPEVSDVTDLMQTHKDLK